MTPVQAVALADAALGAAGHEVTDPTARSVWTEVAFGAISADEAESRIMAALDCRPSSDATTKHIRNWDDYFIPGTTVLRNRLGFVDSTALSAAELALSGTRIVDLALHPVEGQFDLAHLCEIHRRAFARVYSWAGQIRVGPEGRMSKTAPDILHFEPGDPAAPLIPYDYFPAGAQMVRYAETQFAALADLGRSSAGLMPEFVRDLAEVWSELNVAHPFREGNTRTQVVFFSQWLWARGLSLNLSALAPGGSLRQAFIDARFHAQGTGRSTRLADVLGALVGPNGRDS